MNSRIILLALCVFTVIIAVHSAKTREQCTMTRESWGCQSGTKKCHTLCENKGYTGPCTDDCQLACVCTSGYLRKGGEDGECIPSTQC